MLCAGALGNVRSFSLPAEFFCATGRVGMICFVSVGKDKDGGMTLGRQPLSVAPNLLIRWRGAGEPTRPEDFSQF